ncbi:MAG: hypothetical protein NC541_10275 [bacterium]|nr:hypothetical protein [bacterium]
MKNKQIKIRLIAALCAALGWWGLLYPEFTLTPDTVRILCESEDGAQETAEPAWDSDSSLYLELLGADRGSICFRSRLLTELNAFWEAFSWDRSTKN